MEANILIVDDEKSILNSLYRTLNKDGVNLISACSGQEALEIVDNTSIDLVISDYKMPDMSGLDLMVKIKNSYPDIIRIMLTAFSKKKIMQTSINQGEIYRFFTKPWDADELVKAVNTGIKQKSDINDEKNRILFELHQSNIETVMALAEAIELKDAYTKGHCSRVRDFSIQIARAVNLTPELLIHLVYGSLLHDCGKIGVAESILLNPGELTRAQREVIEFHSMQGFELTNPVSHLKTASIFIRQHHERWDGKGYPDGLVGDESHICSRIIAIADTFDAMTSDRPYRKGMDVNKARDILMANSGTQFDPDLVNTFVSILDEKGIHGMQQHPPSSLKNIRPVILFLDDEQHILKTMHRMFMDEPYTVLSASSADEAFDILKRIKVDMVVSDQKMPEITGVQFLKTVKLKYPGVVRIMLSGYADLNEAMAAINEAMAAINEAGIYKFIMKPWKEDEFKTIIANALEWKQMSQSAYELLV